ncbi:hypothetical protein H4R35_005017 [Dimargaris xerosporica]|nr:hypothetical protein H4R35_005017 [Dimargaris xerosporica]
MGPVSKACQLVLDELSQALAAADPKDPCQFCAQFFQEKLAHQRLQLVQLAQSNPSYLAVPHLPEPGTLTVPGITQGLRQSHVHGHTKTVPVYNDAFGFAGRQGTTQDAYSPHTRHPTDTEYPTHSQDQLDDLMHDSEDNEAAMPPPDVDPMIAYNRGRRSSVSAESMAPTTGEEFVKVVIPKSDEQRTRIRTSIGTNFLFRNLDEEQYRDVVDAMVEKHVTNQERVIQQGDIGDYFYVVETGTFDVFVQKEGNSPAKVYEYGPGGCFGELALMYNSPRAATVQATSNAVLWALDRVTFRRILMERTARKRRLYEEFLEEVPLLVSLKPYERHKIADALESVVFEDNEVVIEQGDVGDNFYIIESGEATVTKNEGGVMRVYPSLNKGDYFGELALLNDKPRQATIRAKGKLKCATLGKKAFVRLLGPVVDIIKRNTANYRMMNYIE